MAHYLIYIPGDGTANPKKLVQVGLADHVTNAFGVPTRTGPDGKCGTIFYWQHGQQNGYFPDLQTWVPAVESAGLPADRYWVGIQNASRPQPREMERHDRCDGQLLVLGDNQQWLVPSASRIPHRLRLNKKGKAEYQPDESHMAYWKEATKWFLTLLEIEVKGQTVLLDTEIWEYLFLALTQNYRLTKEVVNHLDLWSPSCIWAAALATIDGLAIREELLAQKKSDTQPDGMSPTPGPEV